jgi:hypothetical protein
MEKTTNDLDNTTENSKEISIWQQIAGNFGISLLFGLSILSPIIYTWLELKVTLGIQIGLGLFATWIFVSFLRLGIITYQTIKEDKWIIKIINIIQPLYLSLGAINALLYTYYNHNQDVSFLELQNVIKISFLLVMGIIAYGSKYLFNFRKN